MFVSSPSFAQRPVPVHPVAPAHGPATPVPVRPTPIPLPRAPVIAPHVPFAPFRNFSGSPFHGFLPSGRRRHFPFIPFFGFPGFFGLRDNSYWFPGCNGFSGDYSCWTPYNSFAPEPLTAPGLYLTPEYLPEGNTGSESAFQGELPKSFLLYLKDGSVFAVPRYTVSDGKLNYVTVYGGDNSISLDLLDLQKTIEANAQRGVTFTLTPPNLEPLTPAPAVPPVSPNSAPNSPGAAPPPNPPAGNGPAAPGPIPPPAKSSFAA